MINPLISIVAPVYNNEAYLRAFIESVISQSYSNWEMVLVDDCSKDRSGAICDEYSHKDKRISVIHHLTNGGICKARNIGIIHSKGEWIMLLDSDDALLPGSIISLIECISDDIDLVSASYLRYVEGVLQKENKDSISGTFSIRDYTELIGVFPQSRNLERYVWNKLFRASIINDNSILFSEDLRLFEDVCFIYQYLECCHKSICCTATPIYSYFRRLGGTAVSSRSHYNDRTLSWLLAYTQIFAIINRMDVSWATKNRIREEIFYIYDHVTDLIRKEERGKEEEKKARALLHSCFHPHDFVIHTCQYYLKEVSHKSKSLARKLRYSVGK
jgi:glycosyltransferase involved in cell wall biosynthesis